MTPEPANLKRAMRAFSFQIETALFGGFFFALTEGGINAGQQLGERHKVALHNTNSGEVLITSVAEIRSRARSMTWQVSVQL